MKNLANCTPTEFLTQTNKIRKTVGKWLKLTDLANIRMQTPKYTPITNEMTDEEKENVKKQNQEALYQQAQDNLKEFLDKMLDEYPSETLEVIALCNFIEPSEIDNYKMIEIITNVYEMLSNKAVVDFFTLLMRLGNRNTLTVVRK